MADLFEKYGEFDSAEEINEAAAGQLEEGDLEALKEIASENGIQAEDVEDYIDGVVPELTNPLLASLGKIDVESAYLEIDETHAYIDWCNWMRKECTENEEFCKAVRKKGKRLSGAFGMILKAAAGKRKPIHEDILKAAGWNHGRVESSELPMREIQEIIRKYYLGGKQDEAN